MNRSTRYTYGILAGGAAAVVALLVLIGPSAPTAGDRAFSIAISTGMFLSVSMLLVSVFSQGGKVQMSPQREAALATGHMDRKTIFENPVLRPLMWLLLLISHRVAMPGGKKWIARQLVAAGSPKLYTAEEYLAVGLLTGILVAMVVGVVCLMFVGHLSLPFMAGGLALGAGGQLFQLHEKAAERTRLISKRVPYALDLVSLAMSAGATFTEAVKTVVREHGSDPFNVELRTMLAEIELGSTRKKALQNMAERIPLDSLRSIIASVVQAEELGTSLGPVLHDQATLLRMQRSLRAENAAAVAGVRILIPCTLLVVAVMLMVFGPFVLRVLSEGLF